jgi:SPP1 gp7 family putative phage head morphogenesis protein
VDFAASSQGSYVTDQYGQRATAYEQRARDIVADGLEKGLGRNDISDRLADELTDPMLGRSAVYWDQVASIHVARARSYGQIASYEEAGVERYQIDEAMDEVTCVICRLMNGKTFDVGSTLDRYKEIEESGDAYAVVTKQPFIKVGKTEDGNRFLYAEGAGGKTHFVAEILDDATGERDDAGSYGRQASEEKLQAVGCSQPPFHGRCRGLTVPA